MKRRFELGKRSHVSRGGRFLAGLALATIGVGVVLVSPAPGWTEWILFGIALVGLLSLVLWKAEDNPNLAEEDLVEVAREAIHNEAARLDGKRLELEKRLMAYGEWMEFPDFDELREGDWASMGRSERDEEVARLLGTESDGLLAKFSDGTYFTEGKFQTRLLLLDLFNFVEKVAKIYQPGSEKPILETNLEAMLKAINRASLQVILLLEELPLIEAKELNLRKVSEGVRTANKVYRKYEELSPYLEPVRYLWHGSKLLLMSNPLLAAGWIAGSELLWKGGKHIGKKALDAYLLSLVRQSLGIIAWETATIYDKTHRYRNPDWVFAVELAHLCSHFEISPDTLRGALREFGKIPLKSSYDRIFLYRCVAQHVSPRPERFCQNELLAAETREQIRKRLEQFRDGHLADAKEKELAKWRKGVETRLDLSSEDAVEVKVM
ncbi:MAG: hypothetical protein KDM64_01660 [Verrucomicrobiae bacterium]|nr:hypothetical protein [Verrucomicrobiae bacterium]